MDNYKFDYLIFIGRFQPFHIGHEQVIRSALAIAEKVIVMIGSAGKPRSVKNPWTYKERAAMIVDTFDLIHSNDAQRILIRPLFDKTYNDQKWAIGVQEIVDEQMRNDMYDYYGRRVGKVGIIGHEKDASSYYLKMFPQWKLVNHEMNEVVHATDLRTLLFERKNVKYLQGLLPQAVFNKVELFTRTALEFTQLVEEYEYIKKYRKSWEVAPYPPTFVTVDAVVVQSAHVLLIQRRASPGADLWAMPGGFVGQDEKLEDAMLRELREETKLKVPAPVLRGSIVDRQIFDAPDRSERGRTITYVYLIQLPPGELPIVKGSDDAKDAKWVPLSDLKEEEMFEDHYHIIQRMIGSV